MSTFLPRKQLNLDFARMALLAGDDYPTELSKLDSIVNFSRASAGGRFNSAGVFEMVAAGQPRFDFDPVTLLCNGLLSEDLRTNLALQSENFGVTWTPIGTFTRTPGAHVATGVSLDLLTLNAGQNSGYSQSIAPSTYGPTTISVHAKAGTNLGLTRFSLIDATAGIDLGRLQINWGTSPPTVTILDGTALVLNQRISADGVYRVAISMPVATAGHSYSLIVYPDASWTAGTVYLGGVQCESGAFATSYIRTTTAAVTRAADLMIITQLSPWFNATEGTWVVEADMTAWLSASGCALSDEVHALPAIYSDVGNGGRCRAEWYDGAHEVAFLSTAIWVGNFRRVAASYSAASLSMSAAGEATQTAANTMVVAPISFFLGSLSGANAINGRLKRLQYIPRAVSAGLLQALST